MFNLLPNLNVHELVKSFAGEFVRFVCHIFIVTVLGREALL